MGYPIQTDVALRSDAARALDALRRIVSTLHESSRAAEHRLGVSGAQLFVLQQLVDAPASSVNELAERTRTHQSSVSVVVRRLVERGLVRRRASRDDARRQEVAITAAGRALLERAVPTAQQRLVEGLDSLATAEARRLADALEGWLAAAGISTGEPPLFFEHETSTRSRKRAAKSTGGGARRTRKSSRGTR